MCEDTVVVFFDILTTIIPDFLDQLTLLWTDIFKNKMLELSEKLILH